MYLFKIFKYIANDIKLKDVLVSASDRTLNIQSLQPEIICLPADFK